MQEFPLWRCDGITTALFTWWIYDGIATFLFPIWWPLHIETGVSWVCHVILLTSWLWELSARLHLLSINVTYLLLLHGCLWDLIYISVLFLQVRNEILGGIYHSILNHFSSDQAAFWMVQSVRPSDRPPHLFHYVSVIISWNFQESLPLTEVMALQ